MAVAQQPKPQFMCNTENMVQYLSKDPFAVDAEWLASEPMGGELRAPCVLPCEFAANISGEVEAGKEITVQGPVGPLQVEVPQNTKAGTTLRYRLAPKPDFRVQVPPGAGPGAMVTLRRADGVEMSVTVPEGHGPGDYFDVTPPALMVRVPKGADRGDYVAFQGPRAPGMNTEWFRAQVPPDLAPGKFFTARLPAPPKQQGPTTQMGWSSPLAACGDPTVATSCTEIAVDTEEVSYQPLRLVPPSQSPVQFLAGDPFSVDCEPLDPESMGGELRAKAALPCELTATLGEGFEAGKSITVQSPIGAVQITPPADAKAGMTLRFRLAPKPDMRVRVPPGTAAGGNVTVRRPDGVEISLTVPGGCKSGDFFEASPPALMVRVPDGAEAGDLVSFHGPAVPNRPLAAFRAQVPAGLEPGKFFTARLPIPRPQQPKAEPNLWSFADAWTALIAD